ncbi:hypothetical protein [Leptospira sp. P2653]|nr:hypothetical protein [Leptospira sp. P2653]
MKEEKNFSLAFFLALSVIVCVNAVSLKGSFSVKGIDSGAW